MKADPDPGAMQMPQSSINLLYYGDRYRDSAN